MAGATRGSTPAPAPRTVGRYLVYGEIASGGMATVHFGRLTGVAGFARSVAIKRLHPQYARDPDFVKMFLDEARLAARIAHPNVVSTLDVVALDDELFLVMDYVRGASLAQLSRVLRQRGERIPPRIATGIVSGVLHGLHAAHEAKSETGARLDIVHRDVSPQNVLVGSDGVARVLDFGVAKAAGRLQTTRDGQLKGKLSYMAPEQLQGGTVTRRTDVYAASVVLWEALAGQRLFKGDNEGNVLARVLEGQAPLPSTIVAELPPALDRVVVRGLQRDPADRYATAREMAQELDAALAVAPAAEIGDWVEHVAARDLEERSNRIAEIESGAASDEETTLMPSSPASAPDAPTPVGKRENEPSTERRASGQIPLEGETVSQVSSVSLSQSAMPPAPDKRRRSVWIASLAAIVAVGVAGAVALVSRHGSEEQPATAASPASAPASAPPAATQPAVPEVPVESLPSGSAAVEPSPPSSASTTAPPPAATPRAPAPAVRHAAGPDCTPPYTTDAKGHLHFKPQCL
ncbi:MAG TPA: serine/threonine-protein kinase [Polyangiaceae bacterium]